MTSGYGAESAIGVADQPKLLRKPTLDDLVLRDAPEEEVTEGPRIRLPSHKSDGREVDDDESIYGSCDTLERLTELIPKGEGGLIWHAELVSETWFTESDCDKSGNIKPRRPILPVRHKDFFASLVKLPDGRWIFSGRLNGWPGLNCLELRSITVLEEGTAFKSASIRRIWDANGETRDQTPAFPEGRQQARATLWMAAWSAFGWNPESPGCCWWFSPHRLEKNRFHYGESMISAMQGEAASSTGGAMPQAVRIHSIAHRYARGERPETNKESLTWHSLILLEWDHGLYCTVVELATLNGVGGRRGKSNWYHDKLEHNTKLYKAMPSEMIMPWKGHFAEVRCADVEAVNLEEFMKFMKQYEGPALRFLDPQVQHSGDVRLCYRSKENIARYLLNYMGRDRRYTEEFRNCQSFAADFYGFVAGKKDITPFHQVNRVLYQNRSHLFMYSPEKFAKPLAKDF